MASVIKVSNSIAEAFNTPELKSYAKYLMYSEKNAAEEIAGPEQEGLPRVNQLPLSILSRIGWSPLGIANGLNFFIGELEKYAVEQYFVYGRIECDELAKREVNLIRLKPEELDYTKPTVVLISGGGFTTVRNVAESLPTAEHFVNSGYQVFILTYRVNYVGAAIGAIEDLARAIKYMVVHKEILGVDPSNIVVAGFGQGATLACNWGTGKLGFRKHGMPKPKAVIAAYPIVDLRAEFARDPKGGRHLVPMFGANYAAGILTFNTIEYVDGGYPPCYVICGQNDDTVSVDQAKDFYELLDRLNVPSMGEFPKNAPHGFGDGTGCDAAGWPERAMEFIELLNVSI